jgi:hypothetical protein
VNEKGHEHHDEIETESHSELGEGNEENVSIISLIHSVRAVEGHPRESSDHADDVSFACRAIRRSVQAVCERSSILAYFDVLRAPILRNPFALNFCNAYSFLPFQIVDPLLELIAFLAFILIL